MAEITCLLTENGLSGTYWSGLPTTDPGSGSNYKDRYDDGASGYNVFATMYDLRIFLYDNQNYANTVLVEIQGKWTDTSAHYLPGGRGAWLLQGYFSMEITTKINGIRDPDSFHYGVPGGGWRWGNTENY